MFFDSLWTFFFLERTLPPLATELRTLQITGWDILPGASGISDSAEGVSDSADARYSFR